MLSKLKQKYQMMRAKNIVQYSDYRRQLVEIPNAVFLHWQAKAKYEFPGIPSDAVFFARAAEGLMMFFSCVSRSKQACALPSKAADSIWHAWNSWSSISLDNFCCKHFGSTIPHVEAENMASDMDAALANCLVTAQRVDGIWPGKPALPRLFALDSKLHMPHGYAYFATTSRIGFQNMNARGTGEGKSTYPESFGAAQLLAAGLITTLAYEEMIKKQAQAANTGSSCGGGSSCGSSSGDSGGCDGGGSSCGSSCGGGCGGGCGS
ncbi:hypothetical protein UNDYM_1394 [Undibacterium sp. YM2]|uniref:hypothetical protein n=1 Tax=Undibacterium sp. YM2 TaxID=2058625 RepID=UPI001331E998|nr:hypothetical protein [Undibacterium sp. YM2]BBB65647.1 hypothetical protein UNDYM_1394 [Undibacterium sp. YM2]